MRKKPNQDVAEARVVKRYHRLHAQLIELIQALQDLVPEGMDLGDRVELTQIKGHVRVAYEARPVEVVINDGNKKLVMKIEESTPQQAG